MKSVLLQHLLGFELKVGFHPERSPCEDVSPQHLLEFELNKPSALRGGCQLEHTRRVAVVEGLFFGCLSDLRAACSLCGCDLRS